MRALSHVATLFPPPRYISLSSVGIDISDTSLKYVRFVRKGHRLGLTHWGSIDIPPGVITHGTIHKPEDLAAVLGRAKGICGTAFARLALPEEQAYLFETTIKQGMSAQEIYDSLEFRLEENVPLSPRDALFDYSIIEQSEEPTLRISVAAYTQKTIASYYDVCRRADIVPLSFEIEAQAGARAIIRAGDAGTYLIVDFGKTRTGIGIIHAGSLIYTSTIDIGARELDTALVAQIGRDLTDEELTKLKNEQGLLESGDENDVYGALLSTLSALRDELRSRIDYWNTHTPEGKDRTIEKLFLCGGNANLAGLPEYFSEELGLEVERANVWRNVFPKGSVVPPISRRYSYGYATAIGLGLRDFLS